jgi:hypothetical protein
MTRRNEPTRTDNPYSTLFWIVISILGLVGVGSFVMSVSRLRDSSVFKKPTPSPQPVFWEVEIISPLSLSRESGSFTATGLAVDKGSICPSGDVYDLEYQDISPVPGELTALLVHKEFVCDDSSGTFEMDLDVRILDSPQRTTGTWQIRDGYGKYDGLEGYGTFTGSYVDENNIIDTYNGGIKSD